MLNTNIMYVYCKYNHNLDVSSCLSVVGTTPNNFQQLRCMLDLNRYKLEKKTKLDKDYINMYSILLFTYCAVSDSITTTFSFRYAVTILCCLQIHT